MKTKPDFVLTLLLMAQAKYSRAFHWEQDQERFRYFCDLADSINSLIILNIETISDFKGSGTFNIMAPVGGPYYIPNNIPIHVNRFTCATFEVIIESNIGHLSLWDDKCGFDNFEILLNNFMRY